MSAVLTERIAQEHAAANAVLSPGVVSSDRRQRALETLTAKGLPTTRDENWKYANLRVLEKVRLAPSAPRARPDITPNELPALIEGYARYTFVDGVFAPGLSRPANVSGIAVSSLRVGRESNAAAAARASDSSQRGASFGSSASGLPSSGPSAPGSSEDIGGRAAAARAARARGSASITAATLNTPQMTLATPSGDSADERFALLNDAFATDGAVIDVGSGVVCPACIELVFVATEPAQAAASYPRLELNVASNARLGIIERHISVHDDTSFVNGAVRVNVGKRAQVTHYRLQQAGAHATWFDTLAATVEQDAKYEIHAVNLGALSARSTLNIQLIGERAELALHVVSLADNQQVQDGFALVEHIAPNTKSEQNVRGIAGSRSRVAFNSKVVVRERAQGTDSRQSLKGLLAGPQAEVDVRPQLEIYTDDVRCNHGATAGKLDDTMLFYLLSRGIDRDTAQQLLKWAFLEDVVSRITVPVLRKHIEASLAGQMRETAALKELI
jgi:Fe-S cluster assembly protein SufD